MFKPCRMLVVGDIMLDKYLWGVVERLSPEAPVPVVRQVSESTNLGGCGNVIANLCGLGVTCDVCSVVGADSYAGEIMKDIAYRQMPINGLIVDKSRPTITKFRVVGNTQQIVRIDTEDTSRLSKEMFNRVASYTEASIAEVDAVIISDYGKGVISRDLISRILARTCKNKPVVVDPKIGNFKFYKGVTSITPNHLEAKQFTGVNIYDSKSALAAAKIIIEKLECESVLITRGAEGMDLVLKDGTHHVIPSKRRKVYDVSGAGDTVISVFTLGIVSGLSMLDAAKIANKAAGRVVEERGTTAITLEKLEEIGVLNE